MKRYINHYENGTPQDILYGDFSLDSTMPKEFLNFVCPDLLKYETGVVDESALKNICGRLTVENMLRSKSDVNTSDTIVIQNEHGWEIETLAYQCQDDTFWLHSFGRYWKIGRNANVLDEVNTDGKHCTN
jgi:hypothetical protein